MITSTILATLGVGSAGGLLIGGVELFLKVRKARRAVSVVRDLVGSIETDFDKLSPESQARANDALRRHNLTRSGVL